MYVDIEVNVDVQSVYEYLSHKDRRIISTWLLNDHALEAVVKTLNMYKTEEESV